MANISITVDGVLVTDITPYRTKLASAREKLAAIYAGFNPAQPEALLAREAEIVALANDAERLREIVDRWDEAEAKIANVLAGWEQVKTLGGDAS